MNKKKVLIGSFSAVLVLSAAIVVGAVDSHSSSAKDNPSTKDGTKANTEMITIEKAEQIALTEVNGRVDSVELEKEHQRSFYEVDMEKGDIEYDIHIDAYSGRILSIEVDDDDSFKKRESDSEGEKETQKGVYSVDDDNRDTDDVNGSGKDSGTLKGSRNIDDDKDDQDDDGFEYGKSKSGDMPAQQGTQQLLSREEAIAIAEKAVSGKVHSFEKEFDDGHFEYELELKTEKGEVEIEMNAANGEILEIEYED